MPLSLQAKMDRIPNLVDYFRNLSGGNSPSAFPVVPAEFSNWRDEQKAWLESVVLLDQTHHMYYEYMRGKDILKLLNKVAANSFRSFEVDRGKQIVCCSPDGYLIGDGILFHLEEEEVMCVGRAIVPNWLRYNAEVEGYDIEFKREARSPSLSMGREVRRSVYRYQIQGPKAADLITKLNGGRPVDLKFFHMGHMTIAGRAVRALRHGMAGVPGLEIWGPFDEWEEVRAAILEAGKEFGIVPVGNKGYSSATFGSGWISSALPAIYTGEAMRPYREWLTADSYEANSPLGGSFVSARIEDYYVTPFELGYGHIVKFDHDFVGRDALERMDISAQRRKVTFEWNADDVGRIFASYFQTEQLPYKWIDLPRADYTAHDYDTVLHHGRPIGLSMLTGYDFNYRAMLSLGIVGPEIADDSEVSIVWGEPNGGTAKPAVEAHRQVEVRAKVKPVPYARTTDRRAIAA